MELPTLESPKPKQKRNKITKYPVTYCFSLSAPLYESLTQHAKFNRKSIAKVIREAITNELNSGRD